MSGVDNNISGFLNEATEIEQRITNAKTNIVRIQELQGHILNSTSTTVEGSATRERENFVSSTRNLLVECKDRVKRIQYDNARIQSSDPNFGIRQQRYNYLKTKLSNVLDEYRQVESDFMTQTKNRMARQYKVVNPNASQQEIDDYVLNSDSQPIFQQALLRTNEAKNALAEVQKRHGDIKNIENTIAELATLYQELNLQVESQDQTIIDIQENVEITVQKTEQTTQELDKATRFAKAARKKKWICLGIAILIIIIIVVVVLTQVLPHINNNNNNPSNNSSNNTSNNTSNPPPNTNSTTPALS